MCQLLKHLLISHSKIALCTVYLCLEFSELISSVTTILFITSWYPRCVLTTCFTNSYDRFEYGRQVLLVSKELLLTMLNVHTLELIHWFIFNSIFLTSNAEKYIVVANFGATLEDCRVWRNSGFRSAQLAECGPGVTVCPLTVPTSIIIILWRWQQETVLLYHFTYFGFIRKNRLCWRLDRCGQYKFYKRRLTEVSPSLI